MINKRAENALKNRRWRETNPEKANAIQKRYRENNKGILSKRRRIDREGNKERDQCVWRLRYATMKGWIKKRRGKVFHHPDYSRPYYGCWVTVRTHMRIHAGLIECPKCVDYTSAVERVHNKAAKDGSATKQEELHSDD